MNHLLDEMEEICRGHRGDIPGVQKIDREDVSREEVIKQYLCIHFPHKVNGLSISERLQRELSSG